MSKAREIKHKNLWDELLVLPENVVGEIFNDELVVSPRPSPGHAGAASRLATSISGPFDLGNGGPGGWRIFFEPELHLKKPPQKSEKRNVIVPDIGGWKTDRMPELPKTAYFESPPDWVCEVLSPLTARYDKVSKMRIYAANDIPHYWIVDPTHKLLEIFVLRDEGYRMEMTFGENDKVSAPPFEAIEFNLGVLWL